MSSPEGLPPLIVVAGSTASGKTALSLGLAEALATRGIPAEIISADSRQVYRGMDIGTAKATPEERARVPHHGLDLVDPDQPFSVADFADHAAVALTGIAGRGAVAILAGGTGFYLRAIARGLAIDELPWDGDVRAAIEATLVADGLPTLVAELQDLAPTRAAAIDLRNQRRVVRALEIARVRGDAPLPEPRGYGRPVLWLGLSVEPRVLGERIRARARAQFEAGLIDETRALLARFDPSSFSFSGIGYAEARAVIDGRLSPEEAIADDARRNVHFGRRQATWFRREPDVVWLDATTDLPLAMATTVAESYLATVEQHVL
ncbi:MAG TPA: tRNA (adenosine(37)-N6)-dimethylallyltransferase MiaA [Terriglobales bacterium]|nr:tRNA (adenosine(37)-N6)-dimethylallyltransferase MiaA [Terriglobales bacterium]